MKKRILSLLMAFCLAAALLPTTCSASPIPYFNVNFDVLVEEPVAGQKPATTCKPRLSDDQNRFILVKMEWSGELDANGCFKNGVAYTVTITQRVSNDAYKYEGAWYQVNREDATLIRIDDARQEVVVSYTFLPVGTDKDALEEERKKKEEEEKWKAYREQYYTEAQADAAFWELNQKELIMNGSEGGNSYFSSLTDDDFSNITRILLDYPNPTARYLTADWPSDYKRCFHNIQELWLGPNVDAKKFFSDLDAASISSNSGSVYGYHSSGILNGKLTIFVPDDQMPKGLLSYSSSATNPPYNVKVYSGDVYEAYKQGASAGRDWCPGHVYTGKVQTASRMLQNMSCQLPNLWYYSCKWCGACEYNAKHTFSRDGQGRDTSKKVWGTHDYGAYDLSDKHYLGPNAKGEKVYLLSCIWCGTDMREQDLSYTYAQYLEERGAAVKDTAEYRKAYQQEMERRKADWAEGGGMYNMITNLKYPGGYAFFVASGKDVTAKVNIWAQDAVNWAAQNDLVDTALLGGDYTGSISRLQFCSVAVRMAEKMTGKAITPAPSGTFTDTDSEYVRKAYAAGITKGATETTFNPDGTLNRQEMAVFIYRALMYVKDNSDIKYTIYDSKLAGYTDSAALASWAVDPMAFMNALGLIIGTSDTTLSPAASCTIEQALVVANRSLQADLIGWYQSLGGTERNITAYGQTAKGGSDYKRGFFGIPDGDIGADAAFNQLRYLQSERFWVTGAVVRPDWERAPGNYISALKIIDPYTGNTLYVQACDFRPVKAG